MLLVLLKEIPVVIVLEKQVLISVSVIIDMVVVSRKQLIHFTRCFFGQRLREKAKRLNCP